MGSKLSTKMATTSALLSHNISSNTRQQIQIPTKNQNQNLSIIAITLNDLHILHRHVPNLGRRRKRQRNQFPRQIFHTHPPPISPNPPVPIIF
jgi:hypothetical protein